MACLAMHLAIAEEYIKINPNENLNVFLLGAISPDLAEDKKISHYGVTRVYKSISDIPEKKVGIEKCSKELDLTNENEKAIYLHLVTDWIFYNYLYWIIKNKNRNINNFLEDIHNDFDYITNYILNHYNIFVSENISNIVKFRNISDSFSKFFTNEQIDHFIKICAKLDLDEAKIKILSDKNKFLNETIKKLNI